MWIEDIDKRGRSHKHFHDDVDPTKKQAVFTVHDQHYHDGAAWQDCDESIADDTSESGYVASLTKTRHIMKFGGTGGRRWIPRREFLNEYVTFGRPQYWTGSAWSNINVGTLARIGNVLTLTRPNYIFRMTATWHGVKLDYILNNTNAYKRIRFAATLTGLTWDGWNLVGQDGKVAGLITRTIASDANGVDMPVTDANTGGYIEFTVTTTGAVFPVTVDPSPLTAAGDTADGYVYGYHTSTYATARSTSYNFDNITTTFAVGQYISQGEYFVYRSFLKFDTSALPDDCTITQVNLKMTCAYDGSATDFNVQIVKQNWSAQDPLAAGNREAAYDNSLAGTLDDNIWRNTNGMSINTEYTSGNLAIAYPSKTGATYYSLRSDEDTNNSAPTRNEYVGFASASHATAAYRSSLVIAYTEAGGAGPTKLKTWNGLDNAKIKTWNGLDWAKVKTYNGLA
jgi:hypothetical protein